MRFEATIDAGAAAAFDTITRPESICFSPSGDRVAVLCNNTETIVVAELSLEEQRADIANARTIPAVARNPHGIVFLDEETLAVAGRHGAVHALGYDNASSPRWTVFTEASGPSGPCSLALRTSPKSRTRELLVGNSHLHSVTSYPLDGDNQPGQPRVAMLEWLETPDQTAVSDDGRWTAVSSHGSHSTLVYDNANDDSAQEPVAVLRGANYPHGVAFTRDGRVLVSDAGSALIFVFEPPDANWDGPSRPTAAIRVYSDEVLEIDRANRMEGGPKGLARHPHRDLFAVTSARLPFALFDLSGTGDDFSPHALTAAEAQAYERCVHEEYGHARRALADRAVRLELIETSRTWRWTRPIQRAYDALRRLSRR